MYKYHRERKRVLRRWNLCMYIYIFNNIKQSRKYTTNNLRYKMRVNVFLSFVFIIIGLCLWLIPTGTEAYSVARHGNARCPPCNIYCPCGNIMDRNNCPSCRCRPSNLCTGRNPNGFGRWPFIKSQIVY